MFDLKNKNIVISGGLGRIALPMTIALLEKHANVFVLTKNPLKHKDITKKLKKQFSKFNLIRCDISKIQSIKSAIKKIKCAPNVFLYSSVIRPVQKNKSENISKWRHSVNDNATSLHISCSLFSELMKKNNGGSVIIVSSIYGIRAPDQNLYTGTKMFTESDYPFLKGGSIIYSNYMASKLGKYNIRFNAIAPGPFPTKGAWSRLMPPGFDDFEDNMKNKIPMKRFGERHELENLASYLMSDGSAYINGEVITIDGGEWLAGAGEFSDLNKLPDSMWKAMAERRKKK